MTAMAHLSVTVLFVIHTFVYCSAYSVSDTHNFSGDDESSTFLLPKPDVLNIELEKVAENAADRLKFFQKDDNFGHESSKYQVEENVCEAGKTYMITSVATLEIFKNEAECIFALGEAPLAPPQGVYFGGILKVLDSGIFNRMVTALWAGKIGLTTQCTDVSTQFNMIFNIAMNEFKYPALSYVGTLTDNLASIEYDDGKPSLFIDYTADFEQVCPNDETYKSSINLGVANPDFPVNQLIDLARVVGYTEDGGQILLGKGILRNTISFPKVGNRTVVWWYAVNYDSATYPLINEPLGPQPAKFTYSHLKIHDFFTTKLPSQIIKDPLSATNTIADYAFRWPLGMPLKSSRGKENQKGFPVAGTSETKNIKPAPSAQDSSDKSFSFSGRT